MLVVVRCPQCRQSMKYQPRTNPIGKTKQCVYCGASFSVNRDRIDRLLKR